MKHSLKKNKSYELKLSVTLDKNDLDYYINEARKHLANDLKVKGFRKGKAPLGIAGDKLDKKEVLETAFNFAFKQSFADILMKEKIDLINAGSLEVRENSAEKLVYSILLTVFPEFRIADYKSIPVKKRDVFVSEEEVAKTLESIRNSRKDGDVVPELNDDFAKSLGRFGNLGELKDSISNGLKKEKEIKESQRVQNFVLDKIAEGTKVEVPPVLTDRQLDGMFLDFDADLHRRGLELGLFLAKIKKTRAELRNEWRPKAEILVKKTLILKEIAKKENIKIEPEEVKEKVNQFLQNFTTVQEAPKNIDLPKLADQIQQILLNQKVLAFLEKEAEYRQSD